MKKRPRRAPVTGRVDWEETRREYAAELVALGAEPAEAEAEAARKAGRARIRIEWASERLDDFFEMQERAGEAYMKQIEEHPDVDWESEDAPKLPDPPEEAVAQAIYAEVMAAIEEDRWPRHLHFRDV
ncbi:MAG TPA: hypothetical protein VF759_12715 [Allosphingosinicella sp.]